jgi:hypothetical protein
MTIMKSITHQLLDAYGVTRLLRDKAAIILERIARGGGAVSWYVCECEAALDAISARFKPGSVISFYFDDRIKTCRAKDLPLDEIGTIIELVGECVVGKIADNGIDIDAYDFCLSSEIRTGFGDPHPESRMIYGAFPERAYTPNSAITFILPDEDGIFRAHPH